VTETEPIPETVIPPLELIWPLNTVVPEPVTLTVPELLLICPLKVAVPDWFAIRFPLPSTWLLKVVLAAPPIVTLLLPMLTMFEKLSAPELALQVWFAAAVSWTWIDWALELELVIPPA
jgi:hypothetical protein